jgi:hypothetical protein
MALCFRMAKQANSKRARAMSSSSKDYWTQDEIAAHEARGGGWGNGGRPIPGIDYSTAPSFMQPVKTNRDRNRESSPEGGQR